MTSLVWSPDRSPMRAAWKEPAKQVPPARVHRRLDDLGEALPRNAPEVVEPVLLDDARSPLLGDDRALGKLGYPLDEDRLAPERVAADELDTDRFSHVFASA